MERELLEQKITRQRRRTTKTVAQKHMIPVGLRGGGEAGGQAGVLECARARRGRRRRRRRRRTHTPSGSTLTVNNPILISPPAFTFFREATPTYISDSCNDAKSAKTLNRLYAYSGDRYSNYVICYG